MGPAINAAGGAIVTSEGKTFKALNGWGTQFDYAAFAFGDNEISKTVCAMATVALNAAKSYYEEKHDRGSFIKDIISDNIMLGDIYVRAKELRVATDVSRGVFTVRALQKGESVPTETIQAMFPDRQNDFVLSVGEGRKKRNRNTRRVLGSRMPAIQLASCASSASLLAVICSIWLSRSAISAASPPTLSVTPLPCGIPVSFAVVDVAASINCAFAVFSHSSSARRSNSTFSSSMVIADD